MNNELTITLTGKEALAYIKKVHTELTPKVDETTEKIHTIIEELTRENNQLKEELKQLKNDIKIKELDEKYSTVVKYEDSTNSSEKDTIISKVIEPNPVSFPASKSNKSSTNWSTDELAIIEQAFENSRTLQSLRLLLPGRSEAAIRSMLNKCGIGIKKDNLYRLY